MKIFAIVLAGCGASDGSEIHEAILTMLAIVKSGATYAVFAPDIPQHHVINHITGKEMPENRNVLVESARIARGDIKPLSSFDAHAVDAIIFPGGFGAAKNLSSFAFDGADCEVNPEVDSAIRAMAKLGKPIGALCISPVIIAKILGEVELTIGDNPGTTAAVEKMGARHRESSHAEVIIDEKHKVYTTPCYMLDANILDIAHGAENIVKAMMANM